MAWQLEGLAALVRGRMTELFERLVTLVGSEEAEGMLTAMQASPLSIADRKDRRGDH